MAKAKNWAVADLSDADVLVLEIDGRRFEVAQFTASWALNEIPQALCMLAVGRDARFAEWTANANDWAGELLAMKPAKVTLLLGGEAGPEGESWPEEGQEVFSGYFTGFSYQKVNGKVALVAHLIHWLADLGFSSCLSSVSHPATPSQLTFPCVFAPAQNENGAIGNTAAQPSGEAGSGALGVFLPALIQHGVILNDLAGGDLWGAIKHLLCSVSSYDAFNPVCGHPAALAGLTKNTKAADALKKIEGPGGPCAMPYHYAQALPLQMGIRQAYAGIATSINSLHAVEVMQMTFWDLLVGGFCNNFHLDVCPLIDRALVIARCNGYRGKNGTMWRTITPGEYDYLDLSAMLPRPLRAVVVHGESFMESGANATAIATGGNSCMAGAWASTAAEDAAGAVLYQALPSWLASITTSGDLAGQTSGNLDQQPPNTALTPGNGQAPKDKPAAEMVSEAQTGLNNFARSLFIQNMLRGRGGTLAGKLRLDIGPGSHVKIEGSPERFIGAEDALATSLYGQVTRVTVEINAETRRAGTSFTLCDLRNEAENQADRTSIDAHPLYGAAVTLGAPLSAVYDEEDPGDAVEVDQG